MSVLQNYDKTFIIHLQNLIHRHFYIQSAPSLYLYMNEKRIKKLNVLNMKTHLQNKRSKILQKYGLKSYYSSKKEYLNDIKSIKNSIKLKSKKYKTE